MTQTRSEALRLRGYGEDVIAGTNGNGHDSPAVAVADGPACVVCSRLLDPDRVQRRAKTCAGDASSFTAGAAGPPQRVERYR